jgi:hypothetical protein
MEVGEKRRISLEGRQKLEVFGRGRGAQKIASC